MCDFTTVMAVGASALSSALSVNQQMQRAAAQRGDYAYLAAQQRNEAATAEAEARQAEQAGEAGADKARQKASLLLGRQQARLAAQGTDLSGSAFDLLGDVAAAGEEDALSLSYRAVRDAWEHRNRGAGRQAQARYYETAAANVDPSLGIAKTLLS